MDKDNAAVNIQDSFLGRARRERALLTVILNSGKKLTGKLRAFDRFTLIVEDRGGEQMIFKHAIATISITRSFSNSINPGAGSESREETRRAKPTTAEKRPSEAPPKDR